VLGDCLDLVMEVSGGHNEVCMGVCRAKGP
jgi:hypothetical protein